MELTEFVTVWESRDGHMAEVRPAEVLSRAAAGAISGIGAEAITIGLIADHDLVVADAHLTGDSPGAAEAFTRIGAKVDVFGAGDKGRGHHEGEADDGFQGEHFVVVVVEVG